MELLLLIKANLKNRKSSFIGVVIITFIITLSFISIVSVNKNISKRVNESLDNFNIGDLNVIIREEYNSDKIISNIKDINGVEKVETMKTLNPEVIINGIKASSLILFAEYNKEEHSFEIYNSSLNGFIKDPVPLKDNEIYVPVTFIQIYNCEIGDIITINFNDESKDYSIKGFIEEPLLGTSTLDVKMIFINNNDFSKLYSKRCLNFEEESRGNTHLLSSWDLVSIYKSNNYKNDITQLKKDINNGTSIIDLGNFSITKDQSIYFTQAFINIISSVMYVFIILLFIISLIIIGHSISSSIEMDYVNLGVLKAQGFSKSKLKLYFLYQYLLAQLIGVIIGIIGSLFLIPFLNSVYLNLTGLLSANKISFIETIIYICSIFIISICFILFKTRKITKISPVKALRGGKDDIYFNSILKLNIDKKLLTLRVAIRQLISNKKEYISATIITSLLMFFMISVTSLNNLIDTENMNDMLGDISGDFTVKYNSYELIDEVEDVINKEVKVKDSFGLVNDYFIVDDEEILGQILERPSYYKSIINGRAPKYDNEIIITEIVSDYLNKGIGDTVDITFAKSTKEFIIVGTYQCLNDFGNIFGMSLESFHLFNPSYKIPYKQYVLEDKSKSKEIVNILNTMFKDNLIASNNHENSTNDMITTSVKAINVIIYVISILFILVVSIMLCGRMFLKEKTDFGIYKSIGFTTSKLRFIFSLRFLCIAIIGSTLGILLNIFLNNSIMSNVLRTIGFSNYVTEYTAVTILIPMFIIVISFFIFSYIISRKISNIKLNELIVE